MVVGALGDPDMVVDSSGAKIELSYGISDLKQIPFIALFPATTSETPNYFTVDFGDDRQFIDVAFFRDPSAGLQTNREIWNIPTYFSFTHFYFVALTKSEVSLFLAARSLQEIQLVKTFKYNFSTDPY